MPELPDITVYIEALERRIGGHVLERVQIAGPFLLRTAAPPIDAVHEHKVIGLRRIGKRIAIGFDNDIWLVFHLMIAGRLHWNNKRKVADGRRTLAALDFDSGTLTLTEAGARKRASLHVIEGQAALQNLDPGGINVMAATRDDFSAALTRENHTLKRSLTDPHFFSGIGNAYSDTASRTTFAHRADQKLNPEEITRLYQATQASLKEWVQRLRDEAAGNFPEKVTAFVPRWRCMDVMDGPVRAAEPGVEDTVCLQ